jgi:hypothetical protein
MHEAKKPASKGEASHEITAMEETISISCVILERAYPNYERHLEEFNKTHRY